MSSCICEFVARIACFCVEDDEELSGERDADDHFGLPGLLQPVVEGVEMRVVLGGYAGDEEEDGARSGASAAHRSVALRLPLSLAMGASPTSLVMALLEIMPISGTCAIRTRDGAPGDALDAAEGASRHAHSGSSSISEAISPASRRSWRLSRTMTSSRLSNISSLRAAPGAAC